MCAVALLLQVKKLNSKIVEKKSALSPIIKELRSLRQRSQVRIACIITPLIQKILIPHQLVFVKMFCHHQIISAVLFTHNWGIKEFRQEVDTDF